MFVQSLSWQTIGFHKKPHTHTQKKRETSMSHLIEEWFIASGLPQPFGWGAFRVHETHPSFLSFPYVCPEPVLVKSSFLSKNGAKKGVLCTGTFVELQPCSNGVLFEFSAMFAPSLS
jgi:hypothetical protein